jgi:hypothetical protein
MTCHVQLQLHDRRNAMPRVLARLHGVGAELDQLHVLDDRACLHLTDARLVRRTQTVLERLADVSVAPGQCLGARQRPQIPLARTTYVVWHEPAAIA